MSSAGKHGQTYCWIALVCPPCCSMTALKEFSLISWQVRDKYLAVQAWPGRVSPWSRTVYGSFTWTAKEMERCEVSWGFWFHLLCVAINGFKRPLMTSSPAGFIAALVCRSRSVQLVMQQYRPKEQEQINLKKSIRKRNGTQCVSTAKRKSPWGSQRWYADTNSVFRWVI